MVGKGILLKQLFLFCQTTGVNAVQLTLTQENWDKAISHSPIQKKTKHPNLSTFNFWELKILLT